MVSLADVVRRVTVIGKTEGVDEASRKLRDLAAAQGTVATATETTSQSTLSMERRINSLQRSLDAEYRAQQNLAKVNKDLSAARAQGLITAQRQAELSDLAAKKFGVESAAAARAAASYKLLKDAAVGLAAGFAGGFLAVGIAQLPGLVDQAVESLAELQDASETLGVTTARLQELQYVGGQTGVATDTLNNALEKFSVNLGLAAQGEGKLYDILQANHVLVSGDLTTDLMNYAELVKNARNEQEKSLLVTAAFGRSAQEMGRFFDDGAEGIKQLGIEAQMSGAIIRDDLVKETARLDDEMEKLAPKFKAAGAELAIAFAPAQLWLMEQITVAAKQLGFALDSIGKGKFGDAASVVFGVEGIGAGAHQRYLDNLMKSGQLSMEPGLGQSGASDFYSGFDQIKKPVEIQVNGGNKPTKLPLGGDAEQSAKAYEKLLETAQKRIDQLGVEAEALGLTGTAADLFRNTQDLINQAEATGIEMSPERIEALTALAATLTDTQLTLEGLQMQMENRSPWETMAEEMERIQDLLDKGKIGWDDYAVGVGKVVEDMVGDYAAGADDVLGNVEKLTDALGLEGKAQFEVQKGLSIARAVVSGGEAIVHSFNAGAKLGGPPVGFAFAAVAAAATAAQIAAIASSSYTSKSVGGAAGGGDASTAAPAATPGQGLNIQLLGKPEDRVRLGDVESVFSELQDWLGVQGKQLVVSYKG